MVLFVLFDFSALVRLVTAAFKWTFFFCCCCVCCCYYCFCYCYSCCRRRRCFLFVCLFVCCCFLFVCLFVVCLFVCLFVAVDAVVIILALSLAFVFCFQTSRFLRFLRFLLEMCCFHFPYPSLLLIKSSKKFLYFISPRILLRIHHLHH